MTLRFLFAGDNYLQGKFEKRKKKRKKNKNDMARTLIAVAKITCKSKYIFFFCLQIDDFIESIEKFVTTLSMARVNLSDRFELDEVDIGYNLDNLKGPQDFLQAASTNLDLVEKLEEVLNGWCKQIDQVQNTSFYFIIPAVTLKRATSLRGPSPRHCA